LSTYFRHTQTLNIQHSLLTFIINARVKTKSRIIVWKGNCLNTTEFVKVETRKSIALNGYITGEVEGILLHISYKLTIDLYGILKQFLLIVNRILLLKLSLKKNKNT